MKREKVNNLKIKNKSVNKCKYGKYATNATYDIVSLGIYMHFFLHRIFFPAGLRCCGECSPAKFINLYSTLPALKRRVPKKKINFPVLDLSFHRFSRSSLPSSLRPLPFPFFFLPKRLLSPSPAVEMGKDKWRIETGSRKVARGHVGKRVRVRAVRSRGVRGKQEKTACCTLYDHLSI